MEPAGERLKKTRLEKGLSLEQVHKKTKIHLHILEALEENHLINMSTVYVRGFLRIYCKFLGLNPDDFLGDLKKRETKEEYQYTYKQTILPKPSVRLSILKPHSKFIRIVAFAVLLFLIGFGSVKLSKAYKNRAVLSSRKTKKELHDTLKQIPSETIRLIIRARQDCWIKAKVDGKVVFSDVLKKGTSQSWQAKVSIELSLGNAGGIELQLNDKIISSLGRKGQVIKQILVTKEEGLKIIR